LVVVAAWRPLPQRPLPQSRFHYRPMRRADRLFQIVQYLRGRRLVTARQLAERLEISERTVYRDIRDLTLSGVPIEGEAGVGYVLRRGADIPPLMFTREEIEALVVGARMVKTWGGRALSDAARQALAKIEAVLPNDLRQEIDRSRLYALNLRASARMADSLDLVRLAINARKKLSFDYTREDGELSSRTVRPLALYFWGPVWTLAAWCEWREAFRNFRVDRMANIVQRAAFNDEPGKTLADFVRRIEEGEG
jgi:predicted DNA-binding transcriptional regulator YafY